MTDLTGLHVLIMATDRFEESELFGPRERLLAAGAEVSLASLKKRPIQATVHDEPGKTITPDMMLGEVDAAGKPVAAICHGPWLLAEADIVRGRTVTSWPSIRTDLKNAGATVVDEEAVTDGNIITSRNPSDVPAFTDALIKALKS